MVVVDEDVDVHDYEQVFFRVGANVDPKRDVLITEGPLDHLDHAPTLQFYGGKLGIDATHKGPAEGTREWPPEIEMSDEVRALVTSAVGGVRDRARSRGTATVKFVKVIDVTPSGASLTVEPNRDQTTVVGSEPLADRLRARRGLRPRRPDRRLADRRRRRRDRAHRRRALGPGLDAAATRLPSSVEPETRAARDAARARANAAGAGTRCRSTDEVERYPR